MAELLNSRNSLLNSAATRILGAGVYITSGNATSFTIPANGTTAVPGTINLTAVPSRYVSPAYTWSYSFGDSGNFTVISGATSPNLSVLGDASFVASATGFSIVQYKVEVVETATQGANPSSFILTLPILRQGVNSVLGVLSNESQTVYADKDGVVPAGTVIQSTLSIYNGTQDDSSNWSATITSSTGVTANLVSGKTISVSLPLNTLNGYVDITATRQGYPNITKRFTVNKVTAGADGVVGSSSALVYAYLRSATAPTTNPGTVEYSFVTNSITTASLLNSWQKTIPSGTDPLYVTIATARSSTDTDTIAASEWSAPVLLVQNGAAGSSGLNNAIVFLYARNNSGSPPTLSTTGSATYTFSTRTLTGTIPTGWSTTIPAESNGSTLWVTQATASSNTSTDSIANTEWSTPQVLARNGSNGLNGLTTTIVYAYQRSTTPLTTNPGQVSYSFIDRTITTTPLANGWQKTIPAGTAPLYVTTATASGYITNAETIEASEWSTPVVLAQNGVDGANGTNGIDGVNGLNTATIFLYARNSSSTHPTLSTTGSATYTFSTKTLAGTVPTGWTTTIPPESNGSVIWVAQATASSTTDTDTIANTEWSAPQVLAKQGEAGASGSSAALVYAYQRNSGVISGSPGEVTYSFVDKAITNTTLLNGWQKSIPSGTLPLYVTVATANSSGTTDTIASSEWSTPVVLAQNGADGSNGVNGLNTATVFLYARNNSNTTYPTLSTTGSATYTFSTRALAGTVPAGWSTTIPAESNGSVLWVAQATASSTTDTDTIVNTEWSTPQVLAKQGEPGVSPTSYDLNVGTQIFSKKATGSLVPSSVILFGSATTGTTRVSYSSRFKIYEDGVLKYTSSTDQSTYTYTPSTTSFSLLKVEMYMAGGTTTLLDSQDIPVVVDGSSSITISLSNSAHVIPADGSGNALSYDGSGTTIEVFEGSTQFTYASSLSGVPGTFTVQTPTVSVANGLVVGTRSGSGTTIATIGNHSAMPNSLSGVTVNYPIRYIRANGSTATQYVTQSITKANAGSIGVRGSRQVYSTDAAYTSTYDFDAGGAILPGAPSYAAKATQLIATVTAGSTPTTPISGDTVTFSNGTNYVYTITHNGTGWNPPGTVIDGNLLVTGSVTAAKINSNGLSIRDNNGNIILSAGSSLQSQINPYEVNATLGATIGKDLFGKMDTSNISTYIDNAAIGTALIADAAIVSAKIADLAVSSANIQDAAINTAKISELGVDSLRIKNGAVTYTNTQSFSQYPQNYTGAYALATINFSEVAQDAASIKAFARVDTNGRIGDSFLQISVDGVNWTTIRSAYGEWVPYGEWQVFVPGIVEGFEAIRTNPTSYGGEPSFSYAWTQHGPQGSLLMEYAVWPSGAGDTTNLNFTVLLPRQGTYYIVYCADDRVNSGTLAGSFNTINLPYYQFSIYPPAGAPIVQYFTTNSANSVAYLSVNCTNTGGPRGFSAYIVDTATNERIWNSRRANYSTSVYKYIRYLANLIYDSDNLPANGWLHVEVVRK